MLVGGEDFTAAPRECACADNIPIVPIAQNQEDFEMDSYSASSVPVSRRRTFTAGDKRRAGHATKFNNTLNLSGQFVVKKNFSDRYVFLEE
jgi:hypothetical protein